MLQRPGGLLVRADAYKRSSAPMLSMILVEVIPPTAGMRTEPSAEALSSDLYALSAQVLALPKPPYLRLPPDFRHTVLVLTAYGEAGHAGTDHVHGLNACPSTTSKTALKRGLVRGSSRS
jgi:hypothetical protein